jgi:hypothetical protein
MFNLTRICLILPMSRIWGERLARHLESVTALAEARNDYL